MVDLHNRQMHISQTRLEDQMTTSASVPRTLDSTSTAPRRNIIPPYGLGERFLAFSGYALIMASVASFATIIFLQSLPSSRYTALQAQSWLQLVSSEVTTIVLLLIGVVTALLGLRLLTTTQASIARTIPQDDYPLISQAVIDGKSDAIDQYVRLRSLGGWAGTFTKLGITVLPLVTVFLTMVFSFISLLPLNNSTNFLDLAKLTLGAFIGSFVQRSVEQRKQEASAIGQTNISKSRSDLPA